jgi:type IV secretion system protein VirB5
MNLNRRDIKSGIMTAAFATIFVASAAQAQIPVTVTSDVPGTAFHIEDIAKYVEQIAQMKMQVEQLKQTYDSMTGTRGIGSLFQNPQLANMLPAEWQNVYSSATNGGYSGISGSVQEIIRQEQGVASAGSVNAAITAVRDREAQKAAYDKAMGMRAYQAAIERLNNIQGLMGQINSSTDPKAIADLQARIQGEQAAIQNEQTKVQLMAMLQKSEDGLIEQQKTAVGQRIFGPTAVNYPSIGQ